MVFAHCRDSIKIAAVRREGRVFIYRLTAKKQTIFGLMIFFSGFSLKSPGPTEPGWGFQASAAAWQIILKTV